MLITRDKHFRQGNIQVPHQNRLISKHDDRQARLDCHV